MTITAVFTNRTVKLGMGQTTIEAPSTDFETVFRRLMYTYGEVTESEQIDKQTKRYLLLARLQHSDTREPYELETELIIRR